MTAGETPEGDAQVDPGPTDTEPPAQPRDEQGRFSAQDMHAVREEAKKYRKRAQDAEQRVGHLQARVDAADRADVERTAAGKLANPDDVWLVHGVDDFRDDDGVVDPEKVDAALGALVKTRPHWAKPGGGFDGGVRRAVQRPDSFGAALQRTVAGR